MEIQSLFIVMLTVSTALFTIYWIIIKRFQSIKWFLIAATAASSPGLLFAYLRHETLEYAAVRVVAVWLGYCGGFAIAKWIILPLWLRMKSSKDKMKRKVDNQDHDFTGADGTTFKIVEPPENNKHS